MGKTDYSFIAFQLTKSGELLPIKDSEFIERLISINIIFIYSISKKHAFIWIGKNVRRSLKAQISTMERKFLDGNPHYSILRHFTIDESQEPMEFYDSLSINKYQK